MNTAVGGTLRSKNPSPERMLNVRQMKIATRSLTLVSVFWTRTDDDDPEGHEYPEPGPGDDMEHLEEDQDELNHVDQVPPDVFVFHIMN